MVLRLSRNSDMEKRLNRRELAYLSADELRSMSDKALGALRTAVADNEYLRDSLRASEDSRKPENKVLKVLQILCVKRFSVNKTVFVCSTKVYKTLRLVR